MLIWRGLGILAPVLLFGGLVVSQLLADGIGGEGTYSSNTAVFAGFGLIVGGILTYLVAIWDENRNPERTLVDPKTGEQVTLRKRSDLFWIPMRYWGLLGVAGGSIAATAGLIGIAWRP